MSAFCRTLSSAGCLILLLAVGAVSAGPAVAPLYAAQEVSGDEAKISAGRELTEAFFDGRSAELWPRLSARMQEQIGEAAALVGFCEQVTAQLGTESEVISETMSVDQGMDVYMRKSRFDKTGDLIIDTVWVTDAEGTIEGFWIRPSQ